jgi:hypothetical protein
MKKILFILIGACCYLTVTYAQVPLKVFENGNVGIGLNSTDTTALSTLSIGDKGDASATAYIYDYKQYGLKVSSSGGSSTHYGIHARATAHGGSPTTAIGVQGEAAYNLPYTWGTGVGIRGLAGGGNSSTRAYGVSGLVSNSYSSANVTAIYGGFGSSEAVFSGIYAGYFEGNVKVTGTINGVTISSSDVRFKKNITGLEERKSLNNVLLMKPIQYNLEQQYVDYEENGTQKKYPVYNEQSQLFQKKHYGLIAQELRELYPDLVYEDDNGYLAVNYTGLIPVLVQSIQELKQELDQVKNAGKMPTTTGVPVAVSAAALFQNAPNPFSQTTQINYYLPEAINAASLCVYDLQGKQLKQYALIQRGKGTQLISASEFPAGIYLYALIADGIEVDIKRMILTE